MSILAFIVCLILILTIVNKLVYHRQINLLEMSLNALIPIVLILIFWGISVYSRVWDIEILNGKVIKKEIQIVPCSHSYQCNCITSCSGSGNNRSCTKICQTCYRHSFDKDYVVKSTIGDFYIDRIDSQGLLIPKRFDIIKDEDPVSKSHIYKNYIKGSGNSIFSSIKVSKEEKKNLPKYPSKIYDYYHIDRTVDVTGFVPELLIKKFNLKIKEILRNQFKDKEHNIVIIIHPFDDLFALKIINFWSNGKKNDILIFIEIDESLNILDVRINSWSKDNLFDVVLKDDILKVKKLSLDIFHIIENNIKEYYFRRSFKEFEYLKWQILPSYFEIVLYITISLIGTLSLGYYFSKTDIKL